MSGQRLIRADLHNHTHFSPDSVLSPKQMVEQAKRRGLDCIAVTDHNTIRGGLAVRDIGGIEVIVGEEVLTAEGEILGLFLSQEVPRDLLAAETISRIKTQGGLAGLPHPFDSARSALHTAALAQLADQLDFVEGLNARIIFSGQNRQAQKFARKHDLPVSAASDAHSPGEIGKAFVEMPPFSGPAEFLQSLRQGRLRGRLSSPFVHMISRYAVIRRWLGWTPA